MEMVTSQGGLAKALNDTNSEYAKSLVSKYGADMALASERTKDEIQNQKDLAAAAAAANAEFDAQAAKIKTRNEAIDKGTAATNAFKNSTAGATDTMESFGEGMTNANGSMVTTTTSLSLFTGAWLTVTAATQAQTDALKALLVAQNAYTDSVANALTVGKGWNDYLAGLADQYKTGAIDILQYKNALTDFSTQLSQDFSGATGKARDAITSLQRAIQSLINSAGGGPSTPTGAWQSPTTQLNQAFNGP
jgi:hypothetical protein